MSDSQDQLLAEAMVEHTRAQLLAELAEARAELERAQVELVLMADRLEDRTEERDRAIAARDDAEFAHDVMVLALGEAQALRASAEDARDLAIAHDRQPYPTADAYESACRALEKHRQRANEAEAELERLRPLKKAAKAYVEEHRPFLEILAAIESPLPRDVQVRLDLAAAVTAAVDALTEPEVSG